MYNHTHYFSRFYSILRDKDLKVITIIAFSPYQLYYWFSDLSVGVSVGLN